MSTGKFEIYNADSTNREFRFRLKASGNHENIGKSEAYTTKQKAKEGIESVRINSLNENSFKIEPTTNDKWYWNLYAGNSEKILSASETYESKQGAEVGIASVMKNTPDADLVDLT